VEKYKVRQDSKSCDIKYCQYDEFHKDYIYNDKWVTFYFSMKLKMVEHKDKSESKDAIDILLNIVKESDPKHFEILEKNLVPPSRRKVLWANPKQVSKRKGFGGIPLFLCEIKL
jgi:hypothetical protein